MRTRRETGSLSCPDVQEGVILSRTGEHEMLTGTALHVNLWRKAHRALHAAADDGIAGA